MLRHFICLLFISISVSSFCQRTGYWNDFSSNSTTNWNGVGAGAFTLTASNGELSIAVAAGGYNNLEHKFSTVDISANPIVKIKVKSSGNFTLRLDLKDANGSYTNASPIAKSISSSSSFVQYVFDFTGKFNLNPVVNPKQIVQLTMFFNPGGSFNGNVTFDDLIVGDQILTTPMDILINQIGYEKTGKKTAIVQTGYTLSDTLSFALLDPAGREVYKGQAQSSQQVTGWKNRYFRTLDFSPMTTEGKYRLKVRGNISNQFEIKKDLLFSVTNISSIDFFKEMRCTVEADKTLSFNGPRNDVVDVFGGWIDATGDPGKHMSHLSYANFFNPQQIPFVTWSLMKSYELSATEFGAKAAAVLDEAAFGADYLVKNVDKDGYLYLAVFDDWGGAPFSREICEWGQEGDNKARTANYQAAMREGAGIAIAALARAKRMSLASTSNSPEVYLTKAEILYAHLKSPGDGFATKNLEYCNDHTENLIDFYCGLLAATELYKATNKSEYLLDAQTFASRLMAQQSTEGWLASDVTKNRPSYHASDEGLPTVALVEYLSVDHARKAEVIRFLSGLIEWQSRLSKEVVNPFFYPRQYFKPFDKEQLPAQKTFFIPHKNETGYWWQGENARLASLSTAWILAGRILQQNYNFADDTLSEMATANLDWIIGKNPFDLCMMTGYGYTTYPGYVGKKNIVGGICNGITSDEATEHDIAWMPYDNGNSEVSYQNWRWVEQWLPHNAWYLLAISALSNNIQHPLTDCHGDLGGKAYFNECGVCIGGNSGNNSRLEDCVPAGLEEDLVYQKTFSVYPNPAKDHIVILSAKQSPFSYTILNAQGMEVRKETRSDIEHTVDVSTFSRGIYNVAVTYDNQVKIVKFVVTR